MIHGLIYIWADEWLMENNNITYISLSSFIFILNPDGVGWENTLHSALAWIPK